MIRIVRWFQLIILCCVFSCSSVQAQEDTTKNLPPSIKAITDTLSSFDRDSILKSFGKVNAYEWILDYDVPESPALSLYEANPNQVMRGSAAKPVAVHILNQFTSRGAIEEGIALDFNPYFVAGGGFKNLKTYWDSPLLRLAANTQMSVATVSIEDNEQDLHYAVGFRTTLVDQRSLLKNRDLVSRIGTALLPKPTDPVQPGTAEGFGTPERNIALTEIYERAREKVKTEEGVAISVGYAFGGKLKSATADLDSLDVNRHHVWYSMQYSTRIGLDILASFIGKYGDGLDPENKLGTAVRYNRDRVSYAGEGVYDFDEKKFHIGGNTEIKLLRQLYFVFALSGSAIREESSDKIKATGAIRWNLSELQKQ